MKRNEKQEPKVKCKEFDKVKFFFSLQVPAFPPTIITACWIQHCNYVQVHLTL